MIDHEQPVSKNTFNERRSGPNWTLWKEIYGTLIGTMPFIVMLIMWGSSINQRLSIVEVEILHAKELLSDDRQAARQTNGEQVRKLDRISLQIEALQQDVARVSAMRLVK